jgi:predicted secreted hydrolase
MNKSTLAPPPVPVPVSDSVIHLPADHYLHPDAPTEWWWHTGTLKAGERIFGFEINAAAFYPAAFTQVMLTDVTNNAHYAQTSGHLPMNWAESDITKDWFVKLGDAAADSSYVTMNAPQSDPTRNMVVKAALVDAATSKAVKFDLTFSQEGAPLIVWGTGSNPNPPGPGGVKDTNYYYSLTRLHASGTITIGDEEPIEVEGLTWMDHEYGLFGTSKKPVKWSLQAMQLNDGVHISNYTVLPMELNTPVKGQATVLFADGTTYFEPSTITPFGRTWKSSMGVVFFMDFKVEIPSFEAEFTVTTLVEAQDFAIPISKIDTYEGVAKVSGRFLDHEVHGTAWNEQQP